MNVTYDKQWHTQCAWRTEFLFPAILYLHQFFCIYCMNCFHDMSDAFSRSPFFKACHVIFAVLWVLFFLFLMLMTLCRCCDHIFIIFLHYFHCSYVMNHFMSPCLCFPHCLLASFVSCVVVLCMHVCIYVRVCVHDDLALQRRRAVPGADELPAFT